MEIDERLTTFIKEHHVLTLAFSDFNSEIWCANAFYVFDDSIPGFIITSEERTRHIKLSSVNNIVAGSIVLETEKIGLIRGLQFKAIIKKSGGSLFDEFRLKYLKRYPYAVLSGSSLWTIQLTEMKYTDNRLGFGTKLVYQF